MASKMTDQEQAFSMMHSTSHDYYLQLADGKRHLLVARNTPLPVIIEEKLSFTHQDQLLARLRVLNEVEGILESVGELWFHRGAFEKRNESNQPEELMLRFSVDEDNIISMKAWSLRDETLCVEAQIARGGLAAKLYNDLEQTLSSIISACRDSSVEYNVLRLSQSVVSTILLASDPITGETCSAQKEKAQRQIQTLKSCQQNNMSPLSQHRFVQLTLHNLANVLSDDEQQQLNTISENLKHALDHLDDSEQLLKLKEDVEAFYHNVPIAGVLTRAMNAAQLVLADYPKDAKDIRNQAKIVTELYRRGDDEAYEDALDRLNYLIYPIFSSSAPSRGRFERDVRL